MDAAQALADLTEVSSQIEGAVLAAADGAVLGSTFSDGGKGERVANAALRLLEAADAVHDDSPRSRLSQVLASTPVGSVFLVRDDRHVVAAVTRPEPTVGLVFYDLKTCLRLVEETSDENDGERATESAGRERAGSGAVRKNAEAEEGDRG